MPMIECGFCDGEGEVLVHLALESAENIWETCPICKGTKQAEQEHLADILPNGQTKPKGWQYLKACQTCPNLATCPDVLQPCEVKAKRARAANAARDRLPRYQGYS